MSGLAEPDLTAPKRSSRATNTRRRRRRALAVIVAIPVLVIGAFATIARSPLLHARVITVTGTSHLTAAAVRRLAGVDASTNVLTLPLEDIQRRLESDPWIARAIVVRSLPATIRIQIHERVPVAAVRRSGTFMVIANDGTMLPLVDAPRSLPRIQDRALPASGPITASAVVGPAGAIGDLPVWLRGEVSVVSVGAGGGLTLELRSGARVWFGTPQGAPDKAAALAALVRWSARSGEGLSTVDVSAASAPSSTFGTPSPVGGASPSPGSNSGPNVSPTATTRSDNNA